MAARSADGGVAARGTTLHDGHTHVGPNDRTIHTNTVKGAFSIFKRGMKGVYQHCGEQHWHPYFAEVDFRYNTRQANGDDDGGRAREAIRGIVCKRPTYA